MTPDVRGFRPSEDEDGRLLAKLASESRPPADMYCHASLGVAAVGVGGGGLRSLAADCLPPRRRPVPLIIGKFRDFL